VITSYSIHYTKLYETPAGDGADKGAISSRAAKAAAAGVEQPGEERRSFFRKLITYQGDHASSRIDRVIRLSQ
ncbi:hypothetical protein, partial [Paenibacillus antibioticophila]|uniref:hypothetical protein n=1 Tax=Paenibacillus antibioticophila TaxID=1274374 RepID=UPI001F4302E0